MGLAAFAAFAAICILLCLCTTISRHNYYQRLASYSKSWGDIPKNPNSNIKTVQPLSQELQINKIADTTPEQPQQLQLKSRDQQMEQLRTEEPPARLEVIHEQDDNMPGQVGV